MVFVGYGIVAPEERWDDLKGTDLRGKLLLMLVNEPPPTAGEPRLFDGEDLTEYGRWTWKFEQAARLGAAGVLLVHTDASAAYPWSVVQTGFGGEKFQLAAEPGGAPLQGWVTEGLARRLAAAGGQDLDALRARALRRDFRPVALGLTAAARLQSEVRRFTQENVAGLVRGTDPALAGEAVVYSAHWDHFGRVGDRIFNGAVDNASGCAAVLAMAEAAAASPARRSQLFLFTFGEEQGLLGAAAWVARPPWPLADTVADLNLESLNWVGPARDVEFLGGDRSTLEEAVRPVAARLGLALRAREPDRSGLFFRSDHWPFARAGVPSVSPGFSLAGQRDYLGDGAAQPGPGEPASCRATIRRATTTTRPGTSPAWCSRPSSRWSWGGRWPTRRRGRPGSRAGRRSGGRHERALHRPPAHPARPARGRRPDEARADHDQPAGGLGRGERAKGPEPLRQQLPRPLRAAGAGGGGPGGAAAARLRPLLGPLHLRHPGRPRRAGGAPGPLPRLRGRHPLLLLLRRQRRGLRGAARRGGRGGLRRPQPRLDHRRHPALQGAPLPLRQRRHGRPGGPAREGGGRRAPASPWW